jgi:hypothetical protein
MKIREHSFERFWKERAMRKFGDLSRKLHKEAKALRG